MDDKPEERHNIIMCPSVSKPFLDLQKNIINPCQKPPEVIQFFIERHCLANQKVLVIGAGAGGDVLGALLAGRNVVAVENDRRQFDLLVTTLKTEMQRVKRADDLRIEKEAAEKKAKEKEESSKEVIEIVEEGSVEPIPVLCQDCGDPIPHGESFQCVMCTDKDLFHECCVYQGDYERYYCEDHANKQ